MASLAHTTVTACNEAVASRTTGQLYVDESTGYIYRYVQFKDAVTYAAGQVLTQASATGLGAVTNDVSGGSSIGSVPAGICLMAQTQNYYGFVLVSGFYGTIKTNGDDDIAAGHVLLIGAADGVCDSAASTWTAGSFGRAMAADVDADNTVAGWVCCLI